MVKTTSKDKPKNKINYIVVNEEEKNDEINKTIQFNKYNDFKNYINSINKEVNYEKEKNDEINNIKIIIYYDKNYYNKKFEENINFNGDLFLQHLKSKIISGNIEVNNLYINNCNNLNEINIYSFSLQKLYIYNSSNNLIINGYYPNLKHINIFMKKENLELYLNGIFKKEEFNLGLTNNINILNIKEYNKNLNIIKLKYEKVNIKNITINNFCYPNDLQYNLSSSVKIQNFYNQQQENIDLYNECSLINLFQKTNYYKNIKTINCFGNNHIINIDNLNNLNKIIVHNFNSVIHLNGNFKKDIIIYGNLKELIIKGNIKNIIIIDKIEKLTFIKCKNIFGDFKNCDKVICIDCNNIFGNFNNLIVNYNLKQYKNKDKDINIICNANILEILNKFYDNNIKINNFFCNINELYLENINEIQSDKILNNVSYNNLKVLDISNLKIKELNDKFINISSLIINNCNNLINIPIYNNLENLIINDCKKLSINLNNYLNINEINGNYFDNQIKNLEENLKNKYSKKEIINIYLNLLN